MFGNALGGGVRIKICGVTNENDARSAIECGADAIGVNLYAGSKRFVELDVARNWLEKLPADISKVAVMVNPESEDALRVGRLPFIDALQLHGQESSEFCRRLADAGIRFAKAVPMIDERSILDLPELHTEVLVLDSVRGEKFGGTGQTFSWELARQMIENHPELNVILAGGLTPENVADAVVQVQPFGVDVASGVEDSSGKKDGAKLQAFINTVRALS
jgi:phosphoribosylanthranilate isomerase